MANTIEVQVNLNDDQAEKDLKNFEKKAGSSGKKAGDNFEDNFEKETRGIGQSLRDNFVAISAGIAAATGALRLFGAAVDNAVAQEAAVTRLNNQLKLTGDFTRESTLDLQSFASELQAVSRFGDEVILNQIALAKAFGATNEQAKEIASAAVDVSAAFGVSLETATRQISRTLGGFAGELAEIVPELRNLTREQLLAGDAIGLLSGQFDGAGKNIRDYDNLSTRLGNTFGDLLEQVGFFVTKNDTLLSSLESGIEVLGSFAGGLRVIREEILGINEQADQTNLEKINTEISTLRNELNSLIDREADLRDGLFGIVLDRDIQQADQLATKITDLRGRIGGLIEERAKVLEQSKEQNAEDQKTNENLDKRLTDQQLFANAQIQTESQILAAAQARQEAIEELRERDLISQEEKAIAEVEIERNKEEQINALRDLQAQRIIEQNQDITEAVKRAAASQQTSFVQLGETINNIATQGFGNAFQNIGRALAEGGNAAQAFTDTIKATFGDLASAIGDFYIKRGIAQTIAKDPGGPALIAAGAGLKVLSGLLGASASGGSGGTATPVEPVGPPGEFNEPAIAEGEPVEEEPVLNQVVVQGDVFQTEDTARSLVDLISEVSEKENRVIIGGGFA